MTERLYRFDLTFSLPDGSPEAEDLLDPLFEAGCDDALIGWGRRKGSLTATFSRRAASAEDAVTSAIRDIQAGAPGATLIDIGPDLVGMSDLARLAECSRQNIRKHVESHPDLPDAAAGDLAHSHWHLAEIGPWLAAHTPLRIPRETLEVAREAMRLNHDLTARRLAALPDLPATVEEDTAPSPRHAASG